MNKSRVLVWALAMLAWMPTTSFAVPISATTARRAVSRWTADRPSAHMRAHMNRPVKDVRTVRADGADAFHIVDLEGGGFVVAAADDRIEPIIAFSDSGTLVEDPRNPLWALLNLDLPQRVKAHRTGKVTKRDPSKLRGRGRRRHWKDPSAEWQALTAAGNGLKTMSTTSATVSDVRVAALIQSTWDQSTVASGRCYNYYTPNNYVCGCVATAGAQLMRYWQFPTKSVSAVSKSCWVDGTAVSKTMYGGTYDWANMPLNPSSSTTETQRQAIGKLCYDVGVAARMAWSSNGSGACDAVLAESLVSVFGYANAKCELSGSVSAEKTENAIYANLDAGCPVLLGIHSDNKEGHEIVADGYGLNDDGVIYTHLNLGWSGSYNAWYALPTVSAGGYNFTVLSSVIYNVFPDKTGELITGRILDKNGNPIAGATISTARNKTTYTATSNANGIYALHVPTATGSQTTQTWSLTVTANGYISNQARVTVGKSTSSGLGEISAGSYSYYDNGTVGNRWGNEIVLRTADGPVPTELSVRGPVKVCAGTATTYVCAVRYSDGTETPVSAEWSISGNTTTSGWWFWPTETVHASLDTDTGVLTAQSDKTNISITAKATVEGTSLSASLTMAVVTAPDPRPNGDAFASAVALSSTSGSATVDTTNATDESGDPLLTFEASATGTVWWKWTAPGDGTVCFDTAGSAIDTILGVYIGTTLTGLTKVTENDNSSASEKTSRCAFACTKGTTYHLSVGGFCGARGSVKVNWAATLDPLPDIAQTDENADERVREIVKDNPSLAANITDVAAYNDFRTWVSDNGIDHALALSSADSFFSFALDQSGIVADGQPSASQIEIREVRLADSGVKLTVAIKDLPVGEQAQRQYLEKVFGVSGAFSPDTAFDVQKVTYLQDMTRNGDGSVSYTVVPNIGEPNPAQFFFKANVTK